jgi:hypothetical protein
MVRRMRRIIRSKKQAKLHWLQDPSKISGDDLNNIRRDASKHFRNKKKENLKDRINEVTTNSKKRTYIEE